MSKYNFSFVACSLRVNEMVEVANLLSQNKSISVEKFGNGNSSTGKRLLVEMRKRIEILTSNELELLLNGDYVVKRQIALLSVCKVHRFIFEFLLEVVRERYLSFQNVISVGSYNSFFSAKLEEKNELNKLTDSTKNKIRQVLFKILEQSGIINSVRNKIIQPQILSEKVYQAIIFDNSKWLKIYLLEDSEIQKLETEQDGNN